MQSLRQSRHLLSAVKAQVERDQERARLRTLDAEDSEPAATTTAAPNDDDDSADPEKAAQDEDSRNHRRPSAESAPRPSLSSGSSDGSSSSEVLDGVSNAAQRVTTACTQYTARAALGHSLTGVHARDRLTHEGKGDKVFVVGWEGPDDPLNPRNWTVSTGWSRFGASEEVMRLSLSWNISPLSSGPLAKLQVVRPSHGPLPLPKNSDPEPLDS